MDEVESTDPADHSDERSSLDLYWADEFHRIVDGADTDFEAADDSDRSTVCSFVALAYHRLGDQDQGRPWLDRALSLVKAKSAGYLAAYVAADYDAALAAETYAATDHLEDDDAGGEHLLSGARLGDGKVLDDLPAVEDEASSIVEPFIFDWLVNDGHEQPAADLLDRAGQLARPWADNQRRWVALAIVAENASMWPVVLQVLRPRFDRITNDERGRAAWHLGIAYSALGSSDEAVTFYRQAATLPGPAQVLADAFAAIADQAEGDQQARFRALADWWGPNEKRVGPDDRAVLVSLLLDLSTSVRSLTEEALGLIGDVPEDDPNWFKWCLGKAMTQHEAVLEQLEQLEQIRSLAEHQAPAARHLFLLHWMVALSEVGRHQEALDALRDARSLRPQVQLETSQLPSVLPADLAVLNAAEQWNDLVLNTDAALKADATPAGLREAIMAMHTRALTRSTGATEAIRRLRALVDSTGPGPERSTALVALAELLFENGSTDQAADLAREPDDADASTALGQRIWTLRLRCAERSGDIDSSIGALAALAPYEPDAAALLGYYLAIYRPGDPESPVIADLVGPPDPPSPMGWIVAANARNVIGRDDAEEALAEALALSPAAESFTLAKITYAMLAVDAGRADGVRAALHGLGQPLLEESLVASATANDASLPLESQLEAIDAALAAPYEKIPTSKGLRQVIWLRRALTLARMNRLDDADRSLDSCWAEQPRETSPPTVIALDAIVSASLLAQQGKVREAVDLLLGTPESIIGLYGPTAQAGFLYLLGSLEFDLGEMHDARRHLARSVALNADVDSLEALGDAELALDDPAAARRELQQALGMSNGARYGVLVSLADAERRLGLYELAIGRARDGIDLDPERPRAWMELGRTLGAAERWEPALSAFERAAKLSRKPETLATLALLRVDALVRLKREHDAIKLIDEAKPADESAHGRLEHYRAVALDRTGDRGGALKALRIAASSPGADSSVERLLREADQRSTSSASWLGFWFGPATSNHRRLLGAVLLVSGAVLATLAAVNPERVSFLHWREGGTLALAPLLLVALLFALPLATTLKVGPIEASMPSPPTPPSSEIGPPDLERVLRHVQNVTARVSASASTTSGAAPGMPADIAMPTLPPFA